MIQLKLKEEEPQQSEQVEDGELIVDEFMEQEKEGKEPSSKSYSRVVNQFLAEEEEKKKEGQPKSRLQISSESGFAVDGKLPEHQNKSQVFQEPSSVSLSNLDASWIARNVANQSEQRDSRQEAAEQSSSVTSMDLKEMMSYYEGKDGEFCYEGKGLDKQASSGQQQQEEEKKAPSSINHDFDGKEDDRIETDSDVEDNLDKQSKEQKHPIIKRALVYNKELFEDILTQVKEDRQKKYELK